MRKQADIIAHLNGLMTSPHAEVRRWALSELRDMANGDLSIWQIAAVTSCVPRKGNDNECTD